MINGFDVLSAPEDALCRLRGNEVSIVFQEPMTALNPLMNIGNQVAEAIRVHEPSTPNHVAMQRARSALNRCELPADRFPLTLYPHELSGGQRQRVVIALAIALQPKLLIADEPTTALDVTTQAEILALLRRLVLEDEMGLMLISHDLAVVTDMADEIAIMKDGEIVENLPSQVSFKDLKHPYSRALFAASGYIPARVRSDQTEPLLSVRNLVCDYHLPRASLLGPAKYFRAVDDVSFDIRKGESLGLVGESGCGKSTLARAILGIQKLSKGEIHFDGMRINNEQDVESDIRRRMQVVFQDPYGSFNPRHRVDRLVSEPFHLYKTPLTKSAKQEAIASALRDVGLEPNDQYKFIHEFSGGQRQRIAIARALIIRPDLILLDEATSALDVSVRAQILDLLAELSESYGLTYLFVSHDLSVVRSITDRVLVMKDGKIVEHGETDDVFSAPKHSYTRKLIASAPRFLQATTR